MSKQVIYQLVIRSFIYTLAMLFIWFCSNQFFDGSFWNGMVVSKSALTVEYCEFNNVDRFFHQAMNTYSNLIYFFFGVLVLHIAYRDYKTPTLISNNRLEGFPLLSALMGFSFIYLSFGSAFFHASLTYMGQRIDMNGTYSVSVTLLSIGLYHVFYKIQLSNTQKYIFIGILLLIIIVFLKISLLIPSSILLPILILLSLVTIGTNYLQFRKHRYLVLAILGLVLIIVAVKIRTLDVQKVNCDPLSIFQGHSIWHLLTALSSFCNYAFFRLQKP
jgi:hypothetical protein